MRLFIALFLFSAVAQGAIKQPAAERIIDQMLQLNKDAFTDVGLTVSSEIVKNQKSIAVSKWVKIKKIGLISFSEKLLEMDPVDEDVFALILCHEMGHFLGGRPYVKVPQSPIVTVRVRNPFENLSVEGQADFYSTNICIKGYMNETGATEATIMAAVSNLMQVYLQVLQQELRTKVSLPKLETESQFVTDRILDLPHEYPSLQCRLDTLVAGLKQSQVSLDRPKCWYSN